jgi:hypothetical protein
MPFKPATVYLSLDSFEPDEEFDALMDLIEVECGADVIHLMRFGPDGYKVDSAMMPSTVLNVFVKYSRSEWRHGVRATRCEVGQPLLLSLAEPNWAVTWRSVDIITRLRPVYRKHNLRVSPYFPIEREV